MKLLLQLLLGIWLTFSITSCGRNTETDENGNKTIDPSIEDDGSGAIYKRMGITKPRSLSYNPSDFHNAHINEILFTNNINLNPETATANDFKSSFKAGETIKGVAYLDKTAGEKFGQNGFPILKYTVGKRKHKWQIERYRKYDQGLLFVEFFISVPLDQYKPTKGGASTIANSMETLSKLKNESYELKASLYTSSGSKTAVKGEITYDATNKKSKDELAHEIEQIRMKHVSSVPLPKANMNEPAIEEQLVDHFNNMGWQETFGKTIILSEDYLYKKSYTGAIVSKTLSVAMVSKNPKGFCMYQVFTVIADKTDDGYSKFRRFSTGDQYGCTCNWN